MKLTRRQSRSGLLSLRLAGALLVCALVPLLAFAAAPGWWSQRGVTNSALPADDYALANQGQLKNLANAAVAELDARLPGGAGDALHDLIAGWSPPSGQTNDFAPVNLGQLKNAAKPFYDRLIAVRYTEQYPWTAGANAPSDFALANVGQVKNLFSFDLLATDPSRDADQDGLPDWWEKYYFGNLAADPNAPAPRGDGVTNLQAFQQGLDPSDYYNATGFNLNLESGDGQMSAVGAWLAQPLVVRVSSTLGAALANAPVAFSSSYPGLSATNGGAVGTSVAVRTDASGRASAYYRQPTTPDTPSTIRAQGGSVVVETVDFGVSTSHALTIPTNGLQLWLQADVGVTLNGQSSVAQWLDQSSNAINLAQGAEGQQPQLVAQGINGKPLLRFDGGNDILRTAGAVNVFQGKTDWTIFLVARPGPSQLTYANILDQQHDSVSFTIEQNGSATNKFGLGNDVISFDSSRMQMLTSVKAGSKQREYMDGINIFDWAASGFSPQVRSFAVGGWIGGSGGRFYNGDIAEVLIYNQVLSDPERRTVESYLNQKYALVAPPVQPPTDLRATGISANQIDLTWKAGETRVGHFIVERRTGTTGAFVQVAALDGRASSYLDSGLAAGTAYRYRIRGGNPAGVSSPSPEAEGFTFAAGALVPLADATLWLRADAGVITSSGGAVAAWTDQSANRFALEQLSSIQQPQLVANGLGDKPVLGFNGQNNLLRTSKSEDVFRGSVDSTIFLVTQPGTTQQQYANILDQQHDSVSFAIEQNGNTTNQYGIGGALFTLDSTRGQTLSSVRAGDSQKDYLNGLKIDDLTTGLFSPQMRPFGIGGWISGGRFYNGNIAEIIVFNRTLSDVERVAVESYLNQKYPPAQPTNVVARGISDGQIDLAWRGGGIAAREFRVERKRGQEGTFSEVATVDGRAHIYVDNGLEPVTAYYYRVIAVSPGAISAPSAEAGAITLEPGVPVPLAGASFWLRADAGVSLNSNGAVAAWTDQSSRHTALTQRYADQKAQLNTASMPGEPFLHFDGQNDLVRTESVFDLFQNSTDYTLFLITRPGATQQTYANMVDQQHDSVGFAIEQNGSLTNQFGLGGETVTLDSSQMQLVGSVKAGTLQHNVMNGVRRPTFNVGPGAFPVRPFGVGGWISGGRFYNGDVAEVIIYNRALREGEVDSVTRYLGVKYLNSLPHVDVDGDGLTNAQELLQGTDRLEWDTNRDGIGDGVSNSLGINPANLDNDNDGLSNAAELALGSNAFKADTDGDGVADGSDAFPLDVSRWQLPSVPGDSTPPGISLLEPTGATPAP